VNHSQPHDIHHTLQTAQLQLVEAGLLDSPKLDAELLLSHALQTSRTYLYTWPEKILSSEQLSKFTNLLKQRLEGRPIAHIIGEREFWGLNLKVTEDTLIPRPDTETIVEGVLKLIAENSKDPAWSILDLGTGSGAIALAIKSELPHCSITAVDYSAKALAVAQQNALTHQLNITFLQSDWLSAFDCQQTFDCIVSNPPYIEADDPHLLQGDVRFEPITALSSGQDGLDDIRTIAQQAWLHLSNQGWLLIEHGYNQAQSVSAILTEHQFSNVALLTDLAGNPRVSIGQKIEITNNN